MGIFAQILCLSPPKTKNSTKMQEKEDQKVVFVSLSIHTYLEHEEHTQKKNPYQPTQDHWLNDSDCPVSKQE